MVQAPAPYLDDDPTQRNPFLQNPDDEDDGTFDTGPTGVSNPYPYIPPAPRLGVTGAPGTAPTPELQQILNSAPSPTQSGNAPVTDAVNNRAQAYAQAVGARPAPPQPKWYQRLAAGALGAAAGYVNASGRRMAPIDVGPAVQGIMGGAKYNRDLQEWQNQVAARQADLGAAQSAQSAWWKNRQLQNQEDLQQAEAQRAKSQSAYYEGRDPASVQRATIAATQKQMENMLKGRDQYGYQKAGAPVPQGAETIQDLSNPGYVYVVSPAMVPLPEELKQYAPGFKSGGLVPWSEFKRAEVAAQQDVVRNQNKPAPVSRAVSVAPGHTLVDPETGKPVYTAPEKPEAPPKPATPMQMRSIEETKNTRLLNAEKDAKRRIAAGEDQDTVYADLNGQKQEIQNAYEGEISAATGNQPGHFEYGAQQATAPQPGGGRGAPTTPTAPKRLTDPAVAAEYVKKAGGDRNKARQLAKADGWTF